MATQKRKQISRRGIIWLVSLLILAVLFVLSLIMFRREAAEEAGAEAGASAQAAETEEASASSEAA